MSDFKQTEPLETEVTWVKGIGPQRAEALKKEGIFTVRDLLWYFPRRWLDRTTISLIRDLPQESNSDCTVIVRIDNFGLVSSGNNSRFVVVASDVTGIINLVWFQRINFWTKAFTVGETVAFSGKITTFRNTPQILHPDFDKLDSEAGNNFFKTGTVVSQYPSTENLKKFHLDSRGFRRILKIAVEKYLKFVDEILPSEILEKQNLIGIQNALNFAHFPQTLEEKNHALKRLKFDEFFFFQLLLASKRTKTHTQETGISFEIVGDYATKFVKEILPFELTESQKNVLREIRADMKNDKPMNRLLQGDVGSGKTVVAFFSCLVAVANGFQAVIMAPTEILAEQHLFNVKKWSEELGIKTEILVGKQRKKLRTEILEKLKSGETKIVVGTHALIEDNVIFHKLGFVVIDEQHRFGVVQRGKLREKGNGVTPDILVMTATPIPRTLAMTLYGDLDVSIIRELPKGRKPIKTKVYFDKDRNFVFEFVRSELQKGRQSYVIYPLVEESEKLDLKAATESYEELKTKVFPEFNLGLLHGRMLPYEKEDVMNDFKAGKIHVLVSTTVVEVGVDVPNASVMVVEHAERFGLSQLHQLRGRVGRGDYQSFCLLITQYARSQDSIQRLKIMEETTDGFRISEEDLQIRGSGDFFGTRQSGIPDFKIAKITEDGDILEQARKEAFLLMEEDPQLRKPEHEKLRNEFKKMLKQKIELSQIG